MSLSTGDRVPADIRIISSVDLEIDESSLTGETIARPKDPKTCDLENHDIGTFAKEAGSGEVVALAERSCIAYMGTLVRNGKPTQELFFVLTKLAPDTRTWDWDRHCHRCPNRIWCHLLYDAGCAYAVYLSELIINMLDLQVDEKRTPLQLSMDELAQKLSFLSFGVIGFICLIGMWQQRPWLDMFTIGGMCRQL